MEGNKHYQGWWFGMLVENGGWGSERTADKIWMDEDIVYTYILQQLSWYVWCLADPRIYPSTNLWQTLLLTQLVQQRISPPSCAITLWKSVTLKWTCPKGSKQIPRVHWNCSKELSAQLCKKRRTVKAFNNFAHLGLSPQSCRIPSIRGLVEDPPTGSYRDGCPQSRSSCCDQCLLISAQRKLRSAEGEKELLFWAWCLDWTC